jgi:16S rRNA (guanine527-N7)-methyltransferase
MNLFGKSTSQNIWKRHFADSAKLYSIIENNIIKTPKKTLKICDVGSGAGFPGLVLDIINKEKDLSIGITLIESNKKKCAFLGSVIKALNLNSFIINDRAENIENNYDLIIARAVAPLPKFFEYCKKISKKGSIFILPKGKKWEEELDQLKKKWNYKVNIVKNNKMIDKSGGVTLVLSNVKKNE